MESGLSTPALPRSDAADVYNLHVHRCNQCSFGHSIEGGCISAPATYGFVQCWQAWLSRYGIRVVVLTYVAPSHLSLAISLSIWSIMGGGRFAEMGGRRENETCPRWPNVVVYRRSGKFSMQHVRTCSRGCNVEAEGALTLRISAMYGRLARPRPPYGHGHEPRNLATSLRI